jgi:hypothetical protein
MRCGPKEVSQMMERARRSGRDKKPRTTKVSEAELDALIEEATVDTCDESRRVGRPFCFLAIVPILTISGAFEFGPINQTIQTQFLGCRSGTCLCRVGICCVRVRGKIWAVRSVAASAFPAASSSLARAAIRWRCGSGRGSTGGAPPALNPYGATQLGRLASSTNERDRGRGPGAEDRRLAKVGWRSHCWSGRRRRVSYAPNSDSVIFSYDMALGQSRAPIASRMRQYA